MPRTKTTWPKGGQAQPPKKGPTGKHAQKNPDSYIPPSDASTHALLERYLCGDTLGLMAVEVGITVPSLRKRFMLYCLSGKADKRYADIVTDSLICRIADADEMLHDAVSMAQITRAEKFMRYTRMDFERRRPHLYGQRAEVTVVGPTALYLGLSETVAPLALPISTTQPLIIEGACEPGEPASTPSTAE